MKISAILTDGAKARIKGINIELTRKEADALLSDLCDLDPARIEKDTEKLLEDLSTVRENFK